MNRLNVMLFDRFDGDESHLRSIDRFCDSEGIVVIVLVALNHRLDLLGWDQFHVMSQRNQFSTPVVRCGTGFHTNFAWR